MNDKPTQLSHPEALPPSLESVIKQIEAFFISKNKEHRGDGEPWYHNFIISGSVRSGVISPVPYALVLCDKQDTAIWQHIKNNDYLTSPTFKERVMDKAVYSLITLAMMYELESGYAPDKR